MYKKFISLGLRFFEYLRACHVQRVMTRIMCLKHKVLELEQEIEMYGKERN